MSTTTKHTPGKFTFREFNPVDGYFALIEGPDGELLCKAYTPHGARCIVDAMNAALAKARREG